MAKRNYSSTTDVRSLNAKMEASDIGGSPNPYTTMLLNTATSNLPSAFPYTLVIEPDVPGKEEIVTVTGSVSTYRYNVTRGQDGTSPTEHLTGVQVKHMVTARDLQEPQDHIYASTGIHGITSAEGDLVGTLKSQTLTNKSLTNPTINAASLTGTITNNGTISGGTISGPTLTGTVTNSGTISGGTITATTAATLATSRNINGTPFNGSANITVTAAAGTLTGSALNSSITSAPGLNVTESQVTNLVTDLSYKLNNPGAWTAWTPTLSWTLNGLTNGSEYIQIGKTVYFNLSLVSSGTISPSGTFTFTLPVQPVQSGYVHGNWQAAGTNYPINASFGTFNTTATVYVPTATSVTANTALSSLALTSSIIPLGTSTGIANRAMNISGFYEVA